MEETTGAGQELGFIAIVRLLLTAIGQVDQVVIRG